MGEPSDPRNDWVRLVLWQYGRFDEDAVPWRRLERLEDKRLPVERIDEQSAWCFGSCGVGGSRIRSIVKRSTLRVAGGDRCASTLGFGSQGYNSGKPNARASCSNKEWIYRIRSSPARRIGDQCNDKC